VPQEIPAGLDTTDPEPLPDLATVSVCETSVKVAVTAASCVSVTEHAPVPEHAPDQPVNVDPGPGEAVSVTVEP
jgi:hypothetical protein